MFILVRSMFFSLGFCFFSEFSENVMTLCCMISWPVWLMCSQRVLVGVVGLGEGKVGARRFASWIYSYGQEQREAALVLCYSTRRELGEWVWESRESGGHSWAVYLVYDRHGLHFSSLVSYLEQNVC